MVTVVVLKETVAGERRVALVPDSVKRLTAAGVEVRVQRGAGLSANLSDEAYSAAGATLIDDLVTGAQGADLIAKVRIPSQAEIAQIPSGSALIALLQPSTAPELIESLSSRGINALALERVPRITRAQSMDVLSSQATVVGYKAVLLGAMELDKFLPMLTTAAGSIAPAKAFVIGAGVAGLQAIATARRLGAVVSAFDVRPAAAEQVKSLGASFVVSDVVSASSETAGGYAREQSDDEQRRTLDTIAAHIPTADLVVTTAQIPGRPAPVLITEQMVASMRAGSVIVDVAAETGGNCALTRLGETVLYRGVRVIGPENLASTAPLHASQMFSRNVLTLLQHMIRDGALVLDPADEITGAMTVTTAAAS